MGPRYTISRYDAVRVSNENPDLPPTYLKRFVLYDHLLDRLISEPFIEKSEEHDLVGKMIERMNNSNDDEFRAYNNELLDYLGKVTFSTDSTYKQKKFIEWKEIS